MEKLEQIGQGSKEIEDKMDDTEERSRQSKDRGRKILKRDIVKRRKEGTHRLIIRGVILESLIENTGELAGEKIKILLEKAARTKGFKETLKIIREN